MTNEQALLAVVRSERERWHELRDYAYGTGDEALIAAMDEASKHYAERNRTSAEHSLVLALLPWVQDHFIQRYGDKTVVSHNEAVHELVDVVLNRAEP